MKLLIYGAVYSKAEVQFFVQKYLLIHINEQVLNVIPRYLPSKVVDIQIPSWTLVV